MLEAAGQQRVEALPEQFNEALAMMGAPIDYTWTKVEDLDPLISGTSYMFGDAFICREARVVCFRLVKD